MNLRQEETLSVGALVLLLRALAEQIEQEQGLLIQGELLPVSDEIEVGLQVRRDGALAELRLDLRWSDIGDVRVLREPGCGSLDPAPAQAEEMGPAQAEEMGPADEIEETDRGQTAGPEARDARHDEPGSVAAAQELPGVCPGTQTEVMKPGLRVGEWIYTGPSIPGEVRAWPRVQSEAVSKDEPACPKEVVAPEEPPPGPSSEEPAPPGLLSWARSPADREALARELGAPLDEIMPLLVREDLLRIKGLGVQDAQLLVAAGVRGMKDLAARKGQKLARVIERPAKEIEGWILAAGRLPSVLEH